MVTTSLIFATSATAITCQATCAASMSCTWDTPMERATDGKWFYEKPDICGVTCMLACGHTEETTDFTNWRTD